MINAEATLWHSERKTDTHVEHYIVISDDKDTIAFILKYDREKKQVIAEPYTPPDINYTIHDACDHENDECFEDYPDSWEYQEVQEANMYGNAVHLLEENRKKRRIADELYADKQRLETANGK